MSHSSLPDITWWFIHSMQKMLGRSDKESDKQWQDLVHVYCTKESINFQSMD